MVNNETVPYERGEQASSGLASGSVIGFIIAVLVVMCALGVFVKKLAESDRCVCAHGPAKDDQAAPATTAAAAAAPTSTQATPASPVANPDSGLHSPGVSPVADEAVTASPVPRVGNAAGTATTLPTATATAAEVHGPSTPASSPGDDVVELDEALAEEVHISLAPPVIVSTPFRSPAPTTALSAASAPAATTSAEAASTEPVATPSDPTGSHPAPSSGVAGVSSGEGAELGGAEADAAAPAPPPSSPPQPLQTDAMAESAAERATSEPEGRSVAPEDAATSEPVAASEG